MSEGDYVVREIRVGDRREAQLLADMWNRSDEGWPGGWTGGVPYTAERILQDFMTWHREDILLEQKRTQLEVALLRQELTRLTTRQSPAAKSVEG